MGGLCECSMKEVRKGLIDYVRGINSIVMKPFFHGVHIQDIALLDFVIHMGER